MSPSATEIENIVRRVLSTLTENGAQLLGQTVSTESVPSNRLALVEQVVSVQTLKNRLAGIQVLQLSDTSVLTPAARDYCREFKVEVVRGNAASNASSVSELKPSRPQRLIVAGSTSNMGAIAKQLCPKQSNVLASLSDDTSAMKSIAEGLRNGHQAGLAIVDAPHAACWQAARDDRMRPAVVSNWSDLADVLREVPANVLILSAKQWNVAAVCNVARRYFQHLQTKS